MIRTQTVRALALPLLLAATAASATPYAGATPYPGGAHYGGPQSMHPAMRPSMRQGMPQTAPWQRGMQRPMQAQQVQDPIPAAIVREGLGKLNAFMESGAAAKPGAVHAYLATEIAPYFDLEYMSRWAAGPLYRRLDPEQRFALAKGLGQLFFQNMATQLAGYQGGEIRYLPSNDPRGREATVRVQVAGANRMPVRIDFRMYRGEEGNWKVFDVQANGRSAVVHYRQLLANMSRQNGIQGMLKQLAAI